MKINLDEFRHLVEGFDLSRDRQDELIHLLAHYWQNVVDRAWSDDSTQLALESRASHIAKDAIKSGYVVNLEKGDYQEIGLTNTFNSKKEK